MSYILFDYDIPQNSGFPNPSGILWGFAYRETLSGWIMRAEYLDTFASELIQDFKDNNIKYNHYVIADSEEEKVRAISRQKLEERTHEIHKSMLETIFDARDYYDKAEKELGYLDSEKQRTDLMLKREQNVKRALKMAGERLNAAVECARHFDEEMNIQHCFDALRIAISSQEISFKAEVEAREINFPSTKKKERKARVQGLRTKILGHSTTSVIQWMGSQGWDFDRAKACLAAHGVEIQDVTIKNQLSVGRNPEGCKKSLHMAELTEEEIKQL